MACRTAFALALLCPLAGCFHPDGGMLEGSTGADPSSTGTSPTDPDTTASTTSMSATTTPPDTTVTVTITDTITATGEDSTGSTGPEPDPVCGNGIPEGDEDCDDMGESETCNEDCTLAACGDALVNAAAGEQCDDGPDNGLTRRCNDVCLVGAGLDGTFGAAWQMLPGTVSGLYPYGLQSFHYAGQTYIHDFTGNYRYDIGAGSWAMLSVALPYGSGLWANAATDADYHWVPRDGALWRFEIATNSWQQFASGLPDGGSDLSAAVFDGEGRIWWHAMGQLVAYDPVAASAVQFPHGAFGDMYETRVAYDPITNSIVFTGFFNDTLAIYSIDDDTFTQVMPSPGGPIHDNTCQDRSGHVYLGSDLDPVMMYQFDVMTQTFTPLPPLPFPHDNNSACVVSSEGYLYVGNVGGILARLPLGTF